MNTVKKMYMHGLFFDHKRIIEMTYSSVAAICKHMDIYKCLNIWVYSWNMIELYLQACLMSEMDCHERADHCIASFTVTSASSEARSEQVL